MIEEIAEAVGVLIVSVGTALVVGICFAAALPLNVVEGFFLALGLLIAIRIASK